MKLKPDTDPMAFIEFGEVGDWLIGRGCIYLIVPEVGLLRLPTEGASGWSLSFDGGLPSLHPSIDTRSADETGPLHWHGWLRAGELVAA